MRLYYLLILLTIITGCSINNEKETRLQENILSSNLEEVKNNKFITTNKKIKLAGANHRSIKTSFSGSYSILTTKDKPFGLSFEYENLSPDRFFNVSVWCKGEKGYGTLVADGMENDYYEAENRSVADSNGWYKIALKFYLPPEIDFKKLKIYVWNNGGDSIYFDDLLVTSSETQVFPKFDIPALRIYIDSNNMDHLKDLRLKAYQNRFIETQDDSYVKVKVTYGNDTLKGKIRFKGDYFEHLKGEKWSFRIKLKKKYSWKGMNTFSLHHPKARDFIDEKVIHDFCRQNDLLATRYGFVPVYLNDKNLGLYAFEEHFRKELVESLNRREGVIIKSSEDEMWYNSVLRNNELITSSIPYFQASAIIPFQENKVAQNKYLFDQFEVAQNLMYQFRNASRPASDIFEIDKLAKFMAVIDIMAGYHGVHWHNMRFYYNPITMRLEPIAFDNFTGAEKVKTLFLGKYMYTKDGTVVYSKGTLGLFEDEVFVEKYLSYLDYYCNNITELLEPVLNNVFQYEALINREFPFYHHHKFYQERIANIKRELPSYKKFIETKLHLNKIEFNPETKNKYEYNKNIPARLVKVYTEVEKTEKVSLQVVNHFNHTIAITGYYNENDTFINLKTKIELPALESTLIKTEIEKPGEIEKLKFETNVTSKDEHIVLVYPWRMPNGEIPIQDEMQKGMSFLKKKGYIKNNKIVFEKGYHKIDNTVIIPAGYDVIFLKGAILDIINNAAFISYSPVNMKGEYNSPVIIKSSDGSALSFTVLQTKGINILNYAIFDQLNALNLNGWTLTGAVNFYETEIEMNNVSFINNRCEDALNIIRSEFKMNMCFFDNIFADAFDSDFSKGQIVNSQFRDVGNDAIDFSGSEVDIKDCKINSIGDKGISGGENSELYVENVSISGANIGVASKDKSLVKAKNITINKCAYGIVVFTKKPTYGPATMEVDQLIINNTKTEQLIEKNSTIIIDGKFIKGNLKNVAEMFYL